MLAPNVKAGGGALAFAHRRRSAAAAGRHVAPHPRAEIHAAILEQLAPSATTASDQMEVTRVRVGYYDGGRELLQPVYRFGATVRSEDARVADRHLLGYVSIGEAPEPLPSLSATPDHGPSEPPAFGERPSEKPCRAAPGCDLADRVTERLRPRSIRADMGVVAKGKSRDSVRVFWAFLGARSVPVETRGQHCHSSR